MGIAVLRLVHIEEVDGPFTFFVSCTVAQL